MSLFSPDLPTGDCVLLRSEADADLYLRTWVAHVGSSVVVLVNLIERSGGSATHLELHDVDGIGQPYHHIYAAFGLRHLRLQVQPHAVEENVEIALVQGFELLFVLKDGLLAFV